MLSSRQIVRAQNILIFIGISLAAYYFFVFRPLDQRASAMDKPLKQAWQRLSVARVGSSGEDELDIAAIEKSLHELRSAKTTVEQARATIEAVVAPENVVRDRMRESFQLVDFQIEQLLRVEELGRLAQQNNVTVAPGVFLRFPEYQPDRGNSELLWAQLSLLHQLLDSAIRSKVSVVENVQLHPFVAHSSSTNQLAFLYEIPMQVQLTGSMESLSKLLSSLPQSHRTGPPQKSGEGDQTPGLFLDRILLRKKSPENPDEASLDLQVCGFVYRENGAAK